MAGDIVGRTIGEILAAKGFLRETPALIEAYDAATEIISIGAAAMARNSPAAAPAFSPKIRPPRTAATTGRARTSSSCRRAAATRVWSMTKAFCRRAPDAGADRRHPRPFPAQGGEEQSLRRRGRGRGAARAIRKDLFRAFPSIPTF